MSISAYGAALNAAGADTKEYLGGFVVIEAPDLDAALEWAAMWPAPRMP